MSDSSNKPAEFARWVTMARAHWRSFQPTRYRRLLLTGTLETELLAAARLTFEAMKDWERMGASHEEAWQAVRELYLFPPEEVATRPRRLPRLLGKAACEPDQGED